MVKFWAKYNHQKRYRVIELQLLAVTMLIIIVSLFFWLCGVDKIGAPCSVQRILQVRITKFRMVGFSRF